MNAPTAGKPGADGRDLRLVGLTKTFGSFVAVDNLDLSVPQGSFFALLGPSGCGKTTTLRMVAGLERPTSGRVLLGDDDVTEQRPYTRPVNTVFQNYALFPHLDVFENVAFGLRRRRQSDVKRRVNEALDLVELGHLAKRKPGQLSGGQQQRVALARAVVNRPDVLLLDEPLGALDLKLRRQMQVELKRIQTEVGITFIHVTHDQDEAMTMADTIAVMNAGRIEQQGPPVDLYEAPATAYVANFLGQSNLVHAEVRDTTGGMVRVDVNGQQLLVPQDGCRFAGSSAPGGSVLVGVRPEKVWIRTVGDDAAGSPVRSGPSSVENRLGGGVVTDASFTGVSTQYLVRLPWGQELMVFAQNVSTHSVLPVGSAVELTWDPAFTFGLDGAQDAAAGIETLDGEEPVVPAPRSSTDPHAAGVRAGAGG